MNRILVAGTALALLAAPAHAQLLGGGGGLGSGLGGAFGGGVGSGVGSGLGGTLGGTVGGAGSIEAPGVPPLRTEALRGAARGAAEGAGAIGGSATADHRTGRAEANGRGKGSLTTGMVRELGVPLGSASGAASAGGSASASGSASAQLIGTDAVRSAAHTIAGRAQTAGAAGAQTAQGLGQHLMSVAEAGAASVHGTATGAAAGAGAGRAEGTAAGSGAGSFGPLAAAGSLAAQAEGAFLVRNGASIFAANGDRIGRVAQVVSDAGGHVRQIVVDTGGARAMLPAAIFHAGGDGLVSAMGEAEIRQAAQQQDQPG